MRGALKLLHRNVGANLRLLTEITLTEVCACMKMSTVLLLVVNIEKSAVKLACFSNKQKNSLASTYLYYYDFIYLQLLTPLTIE